MHARTVMSLNPVTCDVADPCSRVARLMRDRGVGFVVCLQAARVAGVVTDRQLAVACVGGDADPEDPVSRVMVHHPATVHPEDTIFAVIDTFRSAGMVRRVPVVDDAGNLVGVVSLADLAIVAKDLIDAILADELHQSTKEARLLTGAKRLAKSIRRPTKADRIRQAPILPKTEPSREGLVARPYRTPRRIAEPRPGSVARRGGRGGRASAKQGSRRGRAKART